LPRPRYRPARGFLRLITDMAEPGILIGLRPPPNVPFSHHDSGLTVSSYFGVRIDSAVNLLEVRQYAGLDHNARLRRALSDQHRFYNTLLGFRDQAAFDLRILAKPDGSALRVVILGRTWARSEFEAATRAVSVRSHVRSSIPSHINATDILDSDDLSVLLDPFPTGHLDAEIITKREIIATPSRPDVDDQYFFSVAPFNWVEMDWNHLFRALSVVAAPLSVSVALFPASTSPELYRRLGEITTFYGRLAREDERKGGLYYGPQKLPPDSFAVEAERVFGDYLRRCGQTAFRFRIQLTSPSLSTGMVEALGAAISSTESRSGSHLDNERVGAGFETRRLHGQHGIDVARWNLASIDMMRPPGRAEIWGRPDRPQDFLSELCVLGDALDAACAFRLPIAVDGAVPAFPVRRGQFGQSEAYVTTGPAVTIGQTADTLAPLRLPLTAFTKHALVAGSTGSGKTSTVLELLRQLWVDHGIPFLVIEPVNSDADDYRRLLTVSGFADLRVLTVGDEDCVPLRFNPFEVPEGVLVGEHAANLLACFEAAFGLWQPLPSIYQDALNIAYGKAGILSSERPAGDQRRWPTVVEFLKAMGEATSDLGYAGEVKANIEAASIRRARQLTTGPTASTFLTDQRLDIRRLLSGPTVIELKSLGNGDEQALMIALLLNAMTEHYQANRMGSAGLAHVTVIEEAHRLLARPQGGRGSQEAQAKEQAAEAFSNTLAENRKYGEGVIIAEQIPTKLVVDAVKNTNLKIMHRLTVDEDREYLGESMGLDDSQKRFATRLGTGEALVYSDDYAESAHVKVVLSVGFGRPPAVPRSASQPFDACAPCRAKCLYRGAALSMLRLTDLRQQLSDARRRLNAQRLEPMVAAERWTYFLSLLRGKVAEFSALPNEEPGLSDAAFCLFLHSLTTDTMNFSPKWPAAVARRLGLSQSVPTGPG
jgi:hypothetical protein